MNFGKNKKAQATIELVLTFIVLILFLMGIVKTMLWFGNNLGARAQYYRNTRPMIVGGAPPGRSSDWWIDGWKYDANPNSTRGYRQSELSLFKD
ncbi:MAG: pilus assembly protein [Candidatus Omnitrophica bacterium]|nr:pilus assembly protein [Candidatus Omnitrophota bacterium]